MLLVVGTLLPNRLAQVPKDAASVQPAAAAGVAPSAGRGDGEEGGAERGDEERGCFGGTGGGGKDGGGKGGGEKGGGDEARGAVGVPFTTRERSVRKRAVWTTLYLGFTRVLVRAMVDNESTSVYNGMCVPLPPSSSLSHSPRPNLFA